ncbi:MAG: hypothetical protein H6578_11140 [Chitinophagales bacterium]|nr:hypothetical protein [Chitinophagales bacterium]
MKIISLVLLCTLVIFGCQDQCYLCSVDCTSFLFYNEDNICQDEFESREAYIAFVDSLKQYYPMNNPFRNSTEFCGSKEELNNLEEGWECIK